ncbi:hypothetical protein QYE76_023812 [Lolium multiflorum]|uniref:Reverse transcriptase Ty1/copia-type domain-containing protein n=1 Tax=Lolium multiflorum TaxID=4521 RepID=A0AAD8RCE5_LOLMU|nr:hypothetical protein QYE76_023812 [Lolium multiflorum]
MPTSSSQDLVPTPEPTILMEHVENPMEDISETPKRSKRQRTAKSFVDDFIVYLVDDTPNSISGAYASPDANYWKEAVCSEMDSILANGTWEINDRPYGCKPVGCKWVFKKNLRPDGTIDKYKARLVANGYTEKEADKCVYYPHGGGEGVILCLYVDDILIFRTNLKVIEEVKVFLSRCFEMKDLGMVDVILNIKILRDDNGGLTLLQSHYVEKILSRFGYNDCKLSPTPYDPSVLLPPPYMPINEVAPSPETHTQIHITGERQAAGERYLRCLASSRTSTPDAFPNDDFFLDVDDLFDDMEDITNNGHTSASV